MIYYLLLIICFFFFSCGQSFEKKYEKAVEYRENKNYRESNIILHDIINSNDSSEDLKFKAYFLLADIYLNLEYYKESIESYKSILSASIDNPLRKKSLFMIGYIYNNNLDMYSHAKKYYNLFRSDYPNNELIPSVDYELDQINELINKIN